MKNKHADDHIRVECTDWSKDIEDKHNWVDNFNVAPDCVYTIKELAEIGVKACGKEHLEIIYDNTKPDGQYRKDVDSSKLISVMKEFKFTSLGDGIKRVYDNFSQRYN